MTHPAEGDETGAVSRRLMPRQDLCAQLRRLLPPGIHVYFVGEVWRSWLNETTGVPCATARAYVIHLADGISDAEVNVELVTANHQPNLILFLRQQCEAHIEAIQMRTAAVAQDARDATARGAIR
jgi:hypothetical protein